jgi:hypothetical protein
MPTWVVSSPRSVPVGAIESLRADAAELDELVRGLIGVTVNPGRSPERVVVEQRVAKSLNRAPA